MPRPRSLTTDQIADAALAVLDRDGLAALSMRAVARELGMGTMSVYRYVTDREELEVLVVDRVLAEVDVRVPRGSAGRRLAALADRVRTAVGAHPAVTPLLPPGMRLMSYGLCTVPNVRLLLVHPNDSS